MPALNRVLSVLSRQNKYLGKYSWRVVLAALLVVYLASLPRDLFRGTDYSTVVTDRNGALLGARISGDGQWRFPPCDTVPEKFRKAVIQFEDRWFRWHPGFNPVSLVRAAAGNVKAGRVTSGGSTLTMQVIRLSRRRERTVRQKIVEIILATRLELRCGKNEILAMYASHAPFGGNVVGLDAAAWRYYGRPPSELSWGEAATLAVLPNAPSSVRPGRNRDELLSKRNGLLERLYQKGYLDSMELSLALDEPLPDAPVPLPAYASHLVDSYDAVSHGKSITSTVDLPLQRMVEEISDRWNNEFSAWGANDLAAIVIDVRSGDALAYVGNASQDRKRPGARVDILKSPRSTGSILKPVLYCAMLQEGSILPYSLVPDIPININGFSPQNFNLRFSGAVPASEALARSLNVPAVHGLRQYGVPKFLDLLRRCGMSTLTRSASDYGLSLILGGAEGKLLEITSLYASMSRSYQQTDTTLSSKAFPLNDKTALWYTFDALKEVGRPDEIDWRVIPSVNKVAWKTGTSYGSRDGWAVGVTPDYAVGVWVGNAGGGGVPGLTGAQTAGPVMFDIFNMLPSGKAKGPYAADGWFLEPLDKDYVRAEVCRQSGYLRGQDCDQADTLILPKKSMGAVSCPWHRMVNGRQRFILPPSMEWYYRQNHPEYESDASLSRNPDTSPMEFIYPEKGSTIYIPLQLDGSRRGAVFNLAHRNPDAVVFWHLDDSYLGQTAHIHKMTLAPEPGKHSLTVVDMEGNSLSVGFTVAR